MYGNLMWMCAGLGLLLFASPQAGTRGGLYDMRSLINEQHPFLTASGVRYLETAQEIIQIAPIAPPPSTLRFTQPLQPVTQTDEITISEPHRPLEDNVYKHWFQQNYISAGIGANFITNLDGSSSDSSNYSINFFPGVLALSTIGTKLGGDFWVEGEVTYQIADYDQVSSQSRNFTPKGNLKLITGIINISYVLDLGSFKPYLGIGGGLAKIKSDSVDLASLAILEKNTVGFAYQGIAGVFLKISKEWELGLNGRCLRISNQDILAPAIFLNARYNL